MLQNQPKKYRKCLIYACNLIMPMQTYAFSWRSARQLTAILMCLYCKVRRLIWVGCAVRTISTSYSANKPKLPTQCKRLNNNPTSLCSKWERLYRKVREEKEINNKPACKQHHKDPPGILRPAPTDWKYHHKILIIVPHFVPCKPSDENVSLEDSYNE